MGLGFLTLEMRTLIPACLLSQPNSLIVSPALNTTSFLTMYCLYLRLLDALCNHAAPQSNSSYHNYIFKLLLLKHNKTNIKKLNVRCFSVCLILIFSPGNHSRHSKRGKRHASGWNCTHPGICQQTQRPTLTKPKTGKCSTVSATTRQASNLVHFCHVSHFTALLSPC